MIGAMPAVAVRHERRKQEKKKVRPTKLYLGFQKHSPPSRSSSPCHSRAGTPTPSPGQSPTVHVVEDDGRGEFYVCGKVSLLHIVVVSLLLGGIVLIVGLVQLKPGADANANRYYIIAAGGFLVLVGLFLILIHCCILPWRYRRMQRLRKEESGTSSLAMAPNNDAPTTAAKADQNGEPRSKETDVADVTLVDGNPEASRSVSIEMTTSQGSHDTLQSMKSPSEHDALIKKSNSNLASSCT